MIIEVREFKIKLFIAMRTTTSIFGKKQNIELMKILLVIFKLIHFGCYAFILSSCNECDDKQEGRNLGGFTDSYSNFMPSNPFTTLKLLKNGKDTIHFVGQGREEWVEEVSVGMGNCPVYYKLLNHRVNFTNITEGTNNLVIRYNQDGGEAGFDDHIEYKFSNTLFPNSRVVYLGDTSTRIKNFKNINGIDYEAIVIIKRKDTLYYLRNLINSFDRKIARIKYGTDVYELIP